MPSHLKWYNNNFCMKGIETVIATVLVLVIVMFIAILVFKWFSDTFSGVVITSMVVP